MNTLNSPAVEEAMQELKRISADEDERYRALARERALSDAVTDRNAARREGLEEGRLEGEAAVLERLLTRRFGPLDRPHPRRTHAGCRLRGALSLASLGDSAPIRDGRTNRVVDRADGDLIAVGCEPRSMMT